MKIVISLFLILVLFTSGGMAASHKETVGALLGAGTGALIGSTIGKGDGRIAAMVVGTLAGAVVGQSIGHSLGRADRISMQTNAQRALESNFTNQAGSWVNPDTGHAGSLTPLRTYQGSNGSYCREYQQSVTVAGETQQAYGTACRQPDGVWQIVSYQPEQREVVQRVRSVDPDAYAYQRPSPYRVYIGFGHTVGYPYRSHKHHYRDHSHRRGHDHRNNHWGHWGHGRRH